MEVVVFLFIIAYAMVYLCIYAIIFVWFLITEFFKWLFRFYNKKKDEWNLINGRIKKAKKL